MIGIRVPPDRDESVDGGGRNCLAMA